MRGRWGFWVALTALAVGGVLAYQSAVFTSRSGDATPLYSARRHDPYGTAALLDLLQERGVAATTLERPTPRPGSRGVLVQVLTAFSNLPSGRPAGLPSTQPQVPLPQNDALADWVQQGNTVVQFSRTETALMRRLDIRTKEPARRADATDVQDAEQRDVDPADLPGTVSVADAAGPNGFRLRLRSPMSFLDRPHDPAWTPLARDTTKDHAIVAAEYRVGRGRAVFVGAPTPALNGDLGAAQDLDFLLAAAGNGPVLLDEFSHGIGHGATVIGFLLDAGLLPLMLQAAFVAALYVWSTASPVASADDAPPRSRSAAGQIHTLGFLYARSLSPAVTYDRVAAELNRRLALALGCKPADVRTRINPLPAALRDRCTAVFDRLAETRPPREVRCLQCGYDLRGNGTGRCPECGTAVPPEVQRRIDRVDPAETAAAVANRRPDAVFADVLTRSHDLSEEIRRERRRAR